MESLVIATIKSWNIQNALRLKEKLKGNFDVHLVSKKEDLTFEFLHKLAPIYVFFPHWSWIIPPEIYENFECVVFHTANLPYGRGGSPLQNLIVRGIKRTKVCALKVDGGIDTGPIYLKKDVFIALGSAEEILMEISKIIFNEMIPEILERRPQPIPQEGKVLVFKRRRPEESKLTPDIMTNLDRVFDFIRMLDGEGYPRAFIKMGKLRILFSEAHRKSDRVCGRFEIVDAEDEG